MIEILNDNFLQIYCSNVPVKIKYRSTVDKVVAVCVLCGPPFSAVQLGMRIYVRPFLLAKP